MVQCINLKCHLKELAMKLFSMKKYKKHLAIALKAHIEQKTPHGLPYSFHILSVTTEVINALPEENISKKQANIAIACALLHDVLEDTDYDLEKENLDDEVLKGVKALTKNENLKTKQAQMEDSIKRLQKLPKYIQMVKLADRITNLDTPPKHWSKEKIKAYHKEAKFICKSLKSPRGILNKKLEKKIKKYRQYFNFN